LKENKYEWAYYTPSKQRWVNKLLKQAEKYPDLVEILAYNDDGTVHARIPANWFKPPSPPIVREMTEEQKEAGRERLAEYRKNKKE
jgi:hypothetical protein